MESNWYLGLVSLGVWVAVSFGIEILQLKSKPMRDWIDGKSTVLIKNGKILEDNLKKERLTTDELLLLLRKKDVFKVADVEFAMMESSGDVSVLLKNENMPFTPKHLGIKVAPEYEPQAVIMDGQVLEKPLATIGRDKKWLSEQLTALGVKAVQDVYLAQVDSFGELYVDLLNDQIKITVPQKRANTLATMKKCEADLELFCLATEDEKAKQMYWQCSRTMKHIIEKVRPLLIQ
ncbi:hypothetical protein PAV_7c01700 [Paenibacillus alvei DSM 29]|nr:hypothetical protein PAV_7c01700 [Paenibacillus alvei DSM 29]